MTAKERLKVGLWLVDAGRGEKNRLRRKTSLRRRLSINKTQDKDGAQ
jgi:hypothetical protein